MSFLDWLVITLYLSAMLAMACYLGRTQGSRKGYDLTVEKLLGLSLLLLAGLGHAK